MNSTRTRLAEVLREAAAVLTYGFPPRSSLTARSSLIGELDRLALELEQPSDDLSLDEALLKRITDAYAARYAVPAGYAANDIVGEVVRLIEAVPAQQAGELPEIDVLEIFDQFGVQGLSVGMKLNIAHAIRAALAAPHPVSDSAAQTTLAENIRTALAAAVTEKYDECKWEEFLNVFDQNLLEAALATQSQAQPVSDSGAEKLLAAVERVRKADAAFKGQKDLPAISEAHEYQAATLALVEAALATQSLDRVSGTPSQAQPDDWTAEDQAEQDYFDRWSDRPSQAKPEKKNPADAEAEGGAVLGGIVAPAQAVPHDTLRAMRRAIPALAYAAERAPEIYQEAYEALDQAIERAVATITDQPEQAQPVSESVDGLSKLTKYTGKSIATTYWMENEDFYLADEVDKLAAQPVNADDSARLDWLISMPTVVIGQTGTRHGWNVWDQVSGDVLSKNKKTAREAIDSARAAILAGKGATHG